MDLTSKRTSWWQWSVSGLLLLATMINYMDRQTLANLSVRITNEFGLNGEQYGNIEFVFGVAFAFGSLFFGIVADFVSVRWLYPFVLIAWSGVGFATGLTKDYESLLVCRSLLGFFEAGHWPCALIVTQSILSSGERVMGNSVLQSGASLGAILTPLIIRSIVGDNQEPGAWRTPFLVVGAVGVGWVFLWLALIKKHDLPAKRRSQEEKASRYPMEWLIEFITNPRFWGLAAMVISINTSWQIIRAWLPKFLQQGRGYAESEALYFNSAYYIATDVGCLVAGAVGLWLVHRGFEERWSRIIVFAGCSVLAALTIVAAMLPQGWLLLGVLLLIAAGTLGLFPCYYSLSQELTTQHMGKLTGVLSLIGWLASSPMQRLFGRAVDKTGSYDLGFALVGCCPIIGLLIFLGLTWIESQLHRRRTDFRPTK